MRIIKNILVLNLAVIVLSTSNVFANTMPKEWYFSPIENNFASSNNSYDLDKTLDTIISVNNKSAENAGKKNKAGWRLDEIVTRLVLTLEGQLGVRTWGGEKALELTWKKRSMYKNLLKNKGHYYDNNFKGTITQFQGLRTESDIEKVITSLAKGLVVQGKVHDEKLLKNNLMKKALLFQEIIEGVKVARASSSSWTPSGLRLELNIAADASVTGIFANVGGEIRLRFEWKKMSEENEDLAVEHLSRMAENSRQLLSNLATQMTMAIEEEPAAKNLKLETFSVALGIGVSGEVGIAEAAGAIETKVYFEKSEPSKNTLHNLTLVNTNESIPFLKTTRLTLIRGDQVRKGFKKAIRFAEYFQKKLDKDKYKKSDWAVYTIAPEFVFGLSGDVGLATLEGTAGLELEYRNAHF